MAAITRQHCPACAQDFPAHSGGVIPYRCPRCVKLVLGPYCDLEWIGGGGMGDVYRAREPGWGDRTVAIKVPKTDLDPQLAKRRFQREIAASARLTHESVVRAYHRAQEGGRPYLVTEFVAGRKLTELVRPDTPLAPLRVATILLGIARGLAHAPSRGIVNRDIQPDNLLLAEPDETPKILDCGLALITGVDEPATRSGSILGTPNYAAPEQARQPLGVTIAADVHSLGCTAVFCLTGGPPFPEGDLGEVLRLHAEAPRPSVRMLRPDVSDAFDALIQAMMAIEPQDRPSPRQVVDALQTIRVTLADDQATPIRVATRRRIDVECPECGTVYHLLPSAAGRRRRARSAHRPGPGKATIGRQAAFSSAEGGHRDSRRVGPGHSAADSLRPVGRAFSQPGNPLGGDPAACGREEVGPSRSGDRAIRGGFPREPPGGRDPVLRRPVQGGTRRILPRGKRRPGAGAYGADLPVP
ncbi:MAG TPA: serine/threonine-protein kinase [Thermoguttaceae bacterium]|nr:serine/threonine-protein kinase [Thermoguttaceae bacterium]